MQILKNGSYWVWIPRFAYRITYYTDASQSVVKGYYTKWLDIPKYGRSINSNSCYSDGSKKKKKVV